MLGNAAGMSYLDGLEARWEYRVFPVTLALTSLFNQDLGSVPVELIHCLCFLLFFLDDRKNYTKGYSNIQAKVREATSNDPWGPSGTLMNEIAQATYHQHLFMEVMEIIDKRLNDKGKNWRHVYKALTLLDYCLHVGSESVIGYARENLYIIKTLKEFQHWDEDGKDVGANVRQKAKEITNLLLDDSRLQEERRARLGMHNRLIGSNSQTSLGPDRPSRSPHYERPGYVDDDSELQRAIEESKRTAQEHELQMRERFVVSHKVSMHNFSNMPICGSSEQLQQALELSEREAREKEEERRRQEEEMRRMQLMQQQQQQQQQFNMLGAGGQPYPQQQPMPPQQLGFDFFDPLGTSSNPNAYGQGQGGMAYNGGGGYNFQQGQNYLQRPQITGSSQDGFQSMSVGPAMPGMHMSSLGDSMGSNNPFGQMGGGFGASQPQPQQQQQQQQLSFSGLGGTNGFAGSAAYPSQGNGLASAPASSTSFTPSIPPSTSVSMAGSASTPTKDDGKYSKLANLIGNRGDGVDTFGNVGNMRIPYGSGFSSSIGYQSSQNSTSQAANNPFAPAQATGSDLLGLNNDSSSFSTFSSTSQPFATSTSSSTSSAFGNQPSRNPFQPASSQPSNNPWANTGASMSLNDLYMEQQRQKQLQQQQQLQQQSMGTGQGYFGGGGAQAFGGF
ncbi:uncharacterized protein VTP21DRAFT_3120 [Calcarisporiella thermophila]|uniref:uncharacterized protein n=1 Tax=Calcarisporiella thermophila TaxID=911321 RepID=UPI0037433A7E